MSSSAMRAEVAQQLVELLLARNGARQMELAADDRTGLEQRHGVTSFGSGDGAGEPGRTGTHHGDSALGHRRRHLGELQLASGARVHQA